MRTYFRFNLRRTLALGLILSLGGCANTPPEAKAETSGDLLVDSGCEVTYKNTSTFASYLGAGWQNSASANMLIMVSDPQPFFGYDSENYWKTRMAMLSRTVAAARHRDEYVPMIINGDITHYGHGNQRKAFREAITSYASGKPGPLMLPGLGNHDYDQNDDCQNNGCIRDAVCDHIIWTKTIQKSASGMIFDHHYDSAHRRHSGSLSYSVDIGKLHVVQLNLEPTYTKRFETGGSDWTVPGKFTVFDITSAMSWLEKDLVAAKARGQYTIINLHKSNQWQDESIRKGKFRALIEANRVVGIFAGHYHEKIGRQKDTAFGKVPLFNSGSMPNLNWLRLLFDWDKKILQVDAYSNVSHIEEYKYNLDNLQEITPPPTPKPVKITLYSGRNFTGTTCSTSLGEGERKDLKSWCSALVNKPGASMKITDFGYSASSLCLAIPYDVMYKRCYKGAYRGDFEVSDFSKPGQLPAGLYRDALGTEDKGFGTVNYLKP